MSALSISEFAAGRPDEREGQHVKAGDLLVELDSTATGADADRTRQELNAARLEAARLEVVLGLDDGTLLANPPEGVSRQEFDLALAFARSQTLEQEHRLESLAQEIQRQKSSARNPAPPQPRPTPPRHARPCPWSRSALRCPG